MRFLGSTTSSLATKSLASEEILSQYLLEVGQGVRLGLRLGFRLALRLGLGLGASPWRLAERRGPSSSWALLLGPSSWDGASP